MPLAAQSGWSVPTRLYLSEVGYHPQYPAITADKYGHIHIVAARYFEENLSLGNEIYYIRWDGKEWSEPVDIIAVPSDGAVSAETLKVDVQGQIYLLWSTDNLYLSQASSLSPISAHAWVTQMLANNGGAGDITFSSEGHIVVIYNVNDRDIFVRRSDDGGQNWISEELVWAVPSYSTATRNIRVKTGADGTIHLVWTETTEDLDWNPSGIWYARSLDGGESWLDFWSIPDEGSYANLGFDVDGNVHMLWNHNVGATDGRYHSWSSDGGETWTEPAWIFPGLSGRSGYPSVIADGSGTLHQITSGRSVELSGGIYHSVWLNDRWTEPVLVSTSLEDCEGPSIALTEGNQLHIAWLDWDSRDIMYATLQTEAPAVMPAPTPVRTATATAMAVSTPTRIALLADSAESASTLTPPTISFASTPVNIGQSNSTWRLLEISAPVVMLLAIVLAWRWARYH